MATRAGLQVSPLNGGVQHTLERHKAAVHRRRLLMRPHFGLPTLNVERTDIGQPFVAKVGA